MDCQFVNRQSGGTGGLSAPADSRADKLPVAPTRPGLPCVFVYPVGLIEGEYDVHSQSKTNCSVDPFLAAVGIDDGSLVWRQSLPAAVVKGGTAMDHKARIFVSLADGRILCFAAPEG